MHETKCDVSVSSTTYELPHRRRSDQLLSTYDTEWEQEAQAGP